MKSHKTLFIAAYIILLAVINILLFSLTEEKDADFWSGYIFTMLAFILPAIILFMGSIRTFSLKTMFFGMGIIQVSCFYTLIQLIVGVFAMTVKAFNPAAANIIQTAVLGLYSIIVIAAHIGKNVITDIDERTKEKLFRINSIVDDISGLTDSVQNSELRKKLNSLADIAKYSDPMSHASLADLERQIEAAVQKLSSVVSQKSTPDALVLCDEIERMFANRNRKCKALK